MVPGTVHNAQPDIALTYNDKTNQFTVGSSLLGSTLDTPGINSCCTVTWPWIYTSPPSTYVNTTYASSDFKKYECAVKAAELLFKKGYIKKLEMGDFFTLVHELADAISSV